MAIRSSSVLDLIPEYRLARRALTKAREKTQEKAQREYLGEMIRDIDFVLEWLETGRNPTSRKGAERRYTALWDPVWFERYNHASNAVDEPTAANAGLSEAEKWRMAEAMRGLTAREKQCYIMHVAEGLSFAQIARELQVSRGTVQNNIRRARKKIAIAKERSLFLV